MIAMLNTSEDLDVAESEIGLEVEPFYIPGNSVPSKAYRPNSRWAADNGAYARFDQAAFLQMLERHVDHRHLCRFVAVPDVVGSARRTLEVFDRWLDRMRGWPVAFVAQDGIEDLDIPWDQFDAIFIGGSTEWKLGRHAAACVRAAVALNKWVHIGRINTPNRLEYFRELGADSFDGSGVARYSHMRTAINTSFTTGLFT